MGAMEQRQYPRLGLGLPVTLSLLGKGQVHADRRISVVLSVQGGKSCQASGRVVRTVAYKGFAVLFDQDDGGAIEEFIRDLTPLPQESRAALLGSLLKPEIQIY